MDLNKFIFALLVTIIFATGDVLAKEAGAAPRKTTTGFCFLVRPQFEPAIADLLAKLHSEIDEAKKNGKFVAYASVPISNRGGSVFSANNEVAEKTATFIQKKFGPRLHVVNPAAYDLPEVNGKRASGGEYMAVWSDLIGGRNGDATTFDLVYFAGPSDVDRAFKLEETGRLDSVERWMKRFAKENRKFAEHIAEQRNYDDVLRYYGLRASTAYSMGANDEWNIFAELNRSTETGYDIAVYFDGSPIEPGDYADLASPGNAVTCPR